MGKTSSCATRCCCGQMGLLTHLFTHCCRASHQVRTVRNVLQCRSASLQIQPRSVPSSVRMSNYQCCSFSSPQHLISFIDYYVQHIRLYDVASCMLSHMVHSDVSVMWCMQRCKKNEHSSIAGSRKQPGRSSGQPTQCVGATQQDCEGGGHFSSVSHCHHFSSVLLTNRRCQHLSDHVRFLFLFTAMRVPPCTLHHSLPS